ncbi:MAG: glycosyltransferase family 2 protein [Desulfobacteraceae bacterium]|nr:glycosyltransferase family 2 protein [Desulfobacteraceae bacterium]
MDLSIIIPVHNSEKHINRIKITLAPFFNSNGAQIIIIDDASCDGTISAIENLIKTENITNIQFLKNRINKGPAYSRNQGLKIAKGEYIAFLDSDDAWHASKIDFQIAQMKKYHALFCGTEHSILTQKEFLSHRLKPIPADCEVETIDWPLILFKTPFATPSVILHKTIKHYLFNENLKYAEDYHLWIRIAHDFPAIKLKYPLTFTFKHDYLTQEGSLSSKLWQMQKGNMKGFFDLLSSRVYSLPDKLLIISAMLFACLKFIRRGGQKLVAPICKGKINGARSE